MLEYAVLEFHSPLREAEWQVQRVFVVVQIVDHVFNFLRGVRDVVRVTALRDDLPHVPFAKPLAQITEHPSCQGAVGCRVLPRHRPARRRLAPVSLAPVPKPY